MRVTSIGGSIPPDSCVATVESGFDPIGKLWIEGFLNGKARLRLCPLGCRDPDIDCRTGHKTLCRDLSIGIVFQRRR